MNLMDTALDCSRKAMEAAKRGDAGFARTFSRWAVHYAKQANPELRGDQG